MTEPHAQPSTGFATVSGTATYLQRSAMPPQAVLTVRIEDVSRADAAATLLAETREAFGARQVPIPFSLQVPSAVIDPRMSYAVRATITVGSELRFTTTRHHAVLTRGAPNRLDLVLDAVRPAPPAPSAAPTVRFVLPATFAGVMPCADCVGVAQTLTLRADGLYRLRRTYLGKPDDPFVEVGRWSADASGTRLTLRSGAQSMAFDVKDESTLRLLDALGQPIRSATNLELRRTAQVDPVTEPLRWRGEFIYMADAASFTDCESGLRWPVAMMGDYLALERRYAQQRSAPGAPLVVSFDGRLEVRPSMEGPAREQMVIDRFDSVQPGAPCGSAPAGSPQATAALKDTYWKLVELGGVNVAMAPQQQREVRITLASQGSRVIGFSGCNPLVASYAQDRSSLRFTPGAGTRMACAPALMELEGRVMAMLGATTAYRIEGEGLTLMEGARILARFEAVYLR